MKAPLHYGFRILLVCVVCLFSPVALSINVAGLFFPSLAESLGAGKGTVSMYFTFMWLAATISLPLWSQLFEKVSTRVCMSAASALIGISLMGLSFITQLWHLYFWAFIIGLGFPLLLFVATPTLIMRWFSKRTGLIIGICMSFLGIGAFVYNALGGILINSLGWQATYRIFAAVVLLSALPFTVFVVRGRPESEGLLPCWCDSSQLAAVTPCAGISMGASTRTFGFWALIVFTLLTNFGMYAYLMTPSYISGLAVAGELPLLASLVAAFYCLGQVVAKLLFGLVIDKHPISTGLVALILGILGIIGYLVFVESPVLLISSGVLLGFFGAVTNVVLPSITARLFGVWDFSRIYSLVSMAASIAGVLQPLTLGLIYDNFGSTAMYLVVISLIVLSSVFLIKGIRSGDRHKASLISSGEWDI